MGENETMRCKWNWNAGNVKAIQFMIYYTLCDFVPFCIQKVKIDSLCQKDCLYCSCIALIFDFNRILKAKSVLPEQEPNYTK